MTDWSAEHNDLGWLVAASLFGLALVVPGCATSSGGEAGGGGERTATSTDDGARQADASKVDASVQDLDATVWFQMSAEYDAIARQTYRAARRRLDRALEDTSMTAALEQSGDYRKKPPAVILDVDETVLDNSPYQASRIEKGESFSLESWNAWCRRVAAPAIPGAVRFANYAHENGVTVFYVTNREHSVEDATRKNLKKEGFPLAEGRDVVMTKHEREGWDGSKTPRRKVVAKNFRVLLMVGDNLGDFLDDPESNPQERAAVVDKHADRWGESWFVMPNPMYGHWESAALDGHYSMEGPEKVRRKLDRLDMPAEL